MHASLRDTLLRLWTDHVVLTRNFIISSLANLADINDVLARLLKNQEDLGNVFGQYFGPQYGAALTKLLKEHILISAYVVSTAKAGDAEKFAFESQKWQDNADKIAALITEAIPSLPLATTRAMMRDHLALTTKEIEARIRGNWAADVHVFDQVLSQALHMADGLAAGIQMNTQRR